MIRARKEETGNSNTLQPQSDGASSSVEQQRRPLAPHQGNVLNGGIISGIINSNSATPIPLNASGSSSTSNVSAFVASALSASTSSLHLYHNFKQFQRRKSKGSSASASSSSSHWDGRGSTGHWTVQIPKRMMFSTLGVFLILPLFIFLWKETHLAKPVTNETKYARNGNQQFVRGNRNPLASWVADHLPADTPPLYANETNVDTAAKEQSNNEAGSIFLPEHVPKPIVVDTSNSVGGKLIQLIQDERNDTAPLDNDDDNEEGKLLQRGGH